MSWRKAAGSGGRLVRRIFGAQESMPFERFELLEEIGSGCMSSVYKAADRETGSEVAVKLAGTTKDSRIALRNEARMLASLDHPGIVSCLGSGVDRESKPFVALELLEGETLGEMIREGRTIRWEVLGPIIRQVCDALGEIHARGIVHRDVKPDNIIVSQGTAKLIDFGVAQWLNPLKRFRSTFGLSFEPGNLGYAAPEVFGTGADQRADIFSLGAVMHHALSGKIPESVFRFYSRAALEPGLPGNISPIVGKALELEPRKRFQSALEMRHAIEGALIAG